MLALLLVGGCGGSGSSGFDGDPGTDPSGEPMAIRQAVDQGSCVAAGGLAYCGSGATVELASASGSVEIDEPMTPIDCIAVPGAQFCNASVAFTPDGFAVATQYRVATAETVDGPWTLAPDAPAAPTGNEGGAHETTVALVVRSAGNPPAPLVIAVLVYPDGIPQQIPFETARLAHYGAGVIFVSHDLAVAQGTQPDSRAGSHGAHGN